MQRWRVGYVTITRVIESEGPTPGPFLLRDATPENILRHAWLRPHFATPDGKLIASIHALVVESEGLRIVVDTCVGNDKRRRVPQWNQRQGTFLADLAGAGFQRNDINRVVCTHLHVDHVGWNTMLDGGGWVPAFPRARYLVGRGEWEHWSRESDAETIEIMGDSVRPVIDAGLVDLVESTHQITSEVWLEPTPGHTPGHVSVRISSGGAEAVITGDLMHHPSQCAHPEWINNFDSDPEAARRTRRAFLERYADRSVLIFGTHFATPSAGRIVRDGEAWRFRV